MNLKKIVTTAAVLSGLTMGATTASAEAPALINFNANYGTTVTSCALCHTTASTSGVLNAFGANFKTAGGAKAAYTPNWGNLDTMDADNNGVLNGVQIAAGDAPAGNGTLAAITDIDSPGGGSSSGGGCVSSSVTAPLMMVLAMLSLGFFVRRKKD